MSDSYMTQPEAPRPRSKLNDLEKQQVETIARRAVAGGNLGHVNADLVDPATLGDIAAHVKSFAVQQEVFARIGLYPSVVIGEATIPLDIVGSAGYGPELLDQLPQRPDLAAIAADRAAHALRESNLTIVSAPNQQAREQFQNSLFNLLSKRIESARGESGNINNTVYVPGLNVRVISNTSNLKILYSPAIFFNAANGFGNTLSSPVDGFLAPGIYYFGGSGSALGGTVWDTIPEHIPPTSVVNTVAL